MYPTQTFHRLETCTRHRHVPDRDISPYRDT